MTSTNIGSEGYSPKGRLGNSGKDGASVYYTSYIYGTDTSEIQRCILNKSVLTNNPNYQQSDSSIFYENGDIVIDRNGLMLYINDVSNGQLVKIGQLIPKKENENLNISNDDTSISFIASTYTDGDSSQNNKYYAPNESGYYRFNTRTRKNKDLYAKLRYNTSDVSLNDASMYKIIVLLASGHRISKVINSSTLDDAFILVDYQLLFQMDNTDNGFTTDSSEYSNDTKQIYIENQLLQCRAYVEMYKKDKPIKIYPINIT